MRLQALYRFLLIPSFTLVGCFLLFLEEVYFRLQAINLGVVYFDQSIALDVELLNH